MFAICCRYFGGSVACSSNFPKAQSSFPSVHLDSAAHGPAAYNGGSVAAGAGAGVCGAGVVAERTWAEHQKRCIFPYGPYRLSRDWFRFGSQRTVFFKRGTCMEIYGEKTLLLVWWHPMNLKVLTRKMCNRNYWYRKLAELKDTTSLRVKCENNCFPGWANPSVIFRKCAQILLVI